MIAALPVIIGVQMILGALNYDIQNTPQRPLHPALDAGDRPADSAVGKSLELENR
jgi:hypothetical protein